MNTTKYGMRALLASAAAGALVLGSAAGVATAKPSTPKGPKAGYVKVTKVDIKGHSKINLDDPRDVNIRVKVRDTSTTADPTVTGVTLALYASKRAADAVPATPTLTATAVGDPVVHGKAKKWITYNFTVAKAAFAPLEAAVAAGTDGFKGWLCISSVTATATTGDLLKNRQTMHRLPEPGAKKIVRECVKVWDAPEVAPVVPTPTA